MSAAAGTLIPGVEERLPAGERVLWRGQPNARAVARHVFHVRTLAVYFVALLVVRGFSVGGAGASPSVSQRAAGMVAFALCAIAALAMFAFVSRWIARSSVYAVTDRRVVLKIGMTMPITLNIPLSCIESAGVREWGDGTGEIALTLSGTDRFAYFLLWPHARPWHFTRPQPTLRGIASPRTVGALLAAAVAAAGGAPVTSRSVESRVTSGQLVPPTAVAGD